MSGESTRSAILRAAKAGFAAYGFQKATIRAIASEARVDPALVIRHFGSKAELFAKAVEVDLQLQDLSLTDPDRIGETLVGHFLTQWENGDDLLILLRSAAVDEVAATQLRVVFGGILRTVLCHVIADPDEADHRAGLVATQMMGLAFTRYLLRLPPVVAMSRDELVRDVGATIQRYLRAPL